MTLQSKPTTHSKGSGKSFTAAGRRLSAPPADLVRALRELGDEESAAQLVKSYPSVGTRGDVDDQDREV